VVGRVLRIQRDRLGEVFDRKIVIVPAKIHEAEVIEGLRQRGVPACGGQEVLLRSASLLDASILNCPSRKVFRLQLGRVVDRGVDRGCSIFVPVLEGGAGKVRRTPTFVLSFP
jgi:hypothetical protein